MDTSKLMGLMKAKKQLLKQKEKTVKPRPGANRLVILPGWRAGEAEVFFHEFGQHYIKNAAGEIQAVIPCNQATYGNPCAACDGLNTAMRSTTDDETVNLLKEAKAKQGFILNVLDLDGPTKDEPVIYELGKSAFTQLVDTVEEWGAALFDSSEPQIVVVNRDGKGLNTKYSVQVSPKKHTLSPATLSKLHNLDEYVNQENEEQTRRALTAITSVAGLLPAAVHDRPKTLASKGVSLDGDDELSGNQEAALASGGRVGEVAPAGASDKLNEDLDSLLSELDNAA